jgi:hypothetical protein
MWDSIRDWALRELSEVKKAPVAFVLVLCIGAFSGWWVTSRWDEQRYRGRIDDLETRVQLRDDQIRGKDQEIATLKAQSQASPPPSGYALTSWGGGVPQTCGATLNREPLAQYADRYDAAVACGFALANVDKFADRGISISDKYALFERSSIALSIPSSGAMSSALTEWWKVELQKRPPAERPNVRVNLAVWFEVLLVPKDVLITDIRTLSDLRRLGGQVAPGQSRMVIAQNIRLPMIK